MNKPKTTYFTVSNERYFLGTVAMLNSLQLTGNDGDVVILDRGLTPEQKVLLARRAEIVEIPQERSVFLVKPFAGLLDVSGVVVLIDGDMIVNRSLDDIIRRCDHGAICLYGDRAADRWYEEWIDGFALQAPLRRQRYMNAGFVALSASRWPGFLTRWWEACQMIPEGSLNKSKEPYAWADQDALNALLMSEVPAGAVHELRETEAPAFGALNAVKVADPETLVCTNNGEPTTLLHHAGEPKPWEAAGMLKLRRNAYVRLLPRLLDGPDLALRPSLEGAPKWLRTDVSARVLMQGLVTMNAASLTIWRKAVLPIRRGLVGSNR